MSGHSKWSKVKHQKASTDVKKGAAFTKAAAGIIVAVREQGGITDPNKNFKLRLAIEKARLVNMPKDTIKRAIERGAGGEATMIETVTYEAYGPGGVAILVDTATDNKQRTVAEVKNILDRFGGSLATPGAVSYQFARRGVVIIPKTPQFTSDQLLELSINYGADDVIERSDLFEIYAKISSLHNLAVSLTKEGITVQESAIVASPKTKVLVSDQKHEQLLNLTEELENHNDVLDVWTNVDLSP